MQRKILESWKQYSSREFPASFLEDPVAGTIDLGMVCPITTPNTFSGFYLLKFIVQWQ
jgi:hypothetical protein